MTKNFNIKEFQCNCGCKTPENLKHNILVLANQLQVLRDYVKKPIILTNGYRCPKHNKAVGGVSNSQHVLGKAADIKIPGLSPFAVAKIIENLVSEGKMMQGGVGIYNTFTHYDIRRVKSRWDFRK